MAGSSSAKAPGIAGPRGLGFTILILNFEIWNSKISTILIRKSESDIEVWNRDFLGRPQGRSTFETLVPVVSPAQNGIVELSARRHVNSNR